MNDCADEMQGEEVRLEVVEVVDVVEVVQFLASSATSACVRQDVPEVVQVGSGLTNMEHGPWT
jgi:hypothetical protein